MLASLLLLTLQGTDLTTKLPVQLPVCMTRRFTDAKGKARDFVVVAQTADREKLTAAGFSAVICSGLKLDPKLYRDSICKMAASGNQAVQNRLEHVVGVQPKLMCDTAKSLGTTLDSVLSALPTG